MLLTFVPISAIKILHCHVDHILTESTSDDEHHHHSEDCAICHFAFSSFTEVIPITFSFESASIVLEAIFYLSGSSAATIQSFNLRAPPGHI